MVNDALKQQMAMIHTFEDYVKQKSHIEDDLARAITHSLPLPDMPLQLFADGTNMVFAWGESRVIKIFPPFHRDQFETERLVLKHLQGKLSVNTPILEYQGDVSGWPWLVFSKLQGTLLETLWEHLSLENKLVLIRELGALIREVHALPIEGMDCHWPEFIDTQLRHCKEHHQKKGLPANLLQELPAWLHPVEKSLRVLKNPVLLTGEYTPMNLLVQQVEGIWHLSGLLDFGDAMTGLPEYDLLGPAAFLIQGNKALLREFLLAYGYEPKEMTGAFSHRMTALMLLHQYSNLDVQIRIPGWKDEVRNLGDLENLVWGFGEDWFISRP